METVTHTVIFTKNQLTQMLVDYATNNGESENIIDALCELVTAQQLLVIADEHDAIDLSEK